jgi:hypothetical protein
VVIIEMLAPLAIVACVLRWPVIGQIRALTGAVLLIFLALSTRPGDWGRVPWSHRFVEITAPVLSLPEAPMVLMTGLVPTAWVITAFPAEIPFVRVSGFSHHPDEGDAGLVRMARERIEAHRGTFYLLTDASEVEGGAAVIARYGLATDAAACRAIQSNLGDGTRLCPVERRFL